MMTSKWFCFEEAFIYAFMCYFIFYFIYLFIHLFFQKRGIEGCVVSNELIGVVAVSLWEHMRLHLSWPWRDRDCGCGMLRSSQLRGDPYQIEVQPVIYEFSVTESDKLERTGN